ncbi:MAG: 2'-5' RNA ligase family protein, partial [Candidatus Omnitrophota bacterium]
YPRVIWIGAANNEPVLKIVKELERRMHKIGFPKESRPFSAHFTLGRVRSAANREALIKEIDCLNKNLSCQMLEFNVPTLTLFKSTLTPAGPIYDIIFKPPLKLNPA